MKKAVLIPGSFYAPTPLKPGLKASSDDIVELTLLTKLLNDGWQIVSITPNSTSPSGFSIGGSYLIILEKD